MPVDPRYLELAKEKYAWPGGYEMFFITDDGGVLSADTVVAEWDTIRDAYPGDGWYIDAVDSTANTDEEIIDDHTGQVIGGNPIRPRKRRQQRRIRNLPSARHASRVGRNPGMRPGGGRRGTTVTRGNPLSEEEAHTEYARAFDYAKAQGLSDWEAGEFGAWWVEGTEFGRDQGLELGREEDPNDWLGDELEYWKIQMAKGNPAEGEQMPRRVTTENMTISGNPEAVTLQQAMGAMADWLDYESEVVAEAADELREEGEPELAAAAEDQAEAMDEASEALDEAAEEAAEAAAIAFTDEGEPAVEIAAEPTDEGAVVGGNPYDEATDGPPQAFYDEIEQWQSRGLGVNYNGGVYEVYPLENEDDSYGVYKSYQHARSVFFGNPSPGPMLPVGAEPTHEVDPHGSPPSPHPAAKVGTQTQDVPPDAKHWYTRAWSNR